MRKYLLLVIALLCSLSLCALDLRQVGAHTLASGPAETPQLVRDGKNYGLMLSATFVNDMHTRAVWDFTINENMTHCAGIRMRFYASQTAIVRQFNLYVKTGNIWQAATFTPQCDNAWQEVFIPKSAFCPEKSGTASWQKCSTLRLALWKGATGRCALQLASLELVRPNVPVAIVRSGLSGKTFREGWKYAAYVNQALADYGILPAVIEQEDTTYLNLRPYSFICLPYAMSTTPEQQTVLSSFIKLGGKAAVFHTVPNLLQQYLGMPAGTFTTAARLPRPLAGVVADRQVLPNGHNFRQASTAFIAVSNITAPLKVAAHWMDADGKVTPWPAVIMSPSGFWMTHVYLHQDATNAAGMFAALMAQYVPNLLQHAAYERYQEGLRAFDDSRVTGLHRANARHVLETARDAYQSARFETAIAMLDDCRRILQNATTTVLPPKQNELRAIWCNHPDGLPGQEWETCAKLLFNSHFNAVFLWAATPFVARYPTTIAPFITDGKSLGSCVTECRKNGIQVHAWLNCLSIEDSMNNPSMGAVFEQWRQAGRLQQDVNGRTLPWLCPSQRANHTHVSRIAAEMAMNYPLDGIHLDFVRFPSSQSCFCGKCRQAFELYLGQPCPNWPKMAMPGGVFHQQWLIFRQRLITALVQEITTSVRQVRPGIKVSAAVFPDLESARSNVGQDWISWLNYQFLDFICPMNYQASANQFATDIERQKRQIGGNAEKILPGIGGSVKHLSLTETQKQVYAARQAGTAGSILFKLDLREAQDILPELFK